MAGNRALIRPYQSADLNDLYRICLQTADNGRDATAQFRDPMLPGQVFAAPYAIFEPSLAWVAEDAAGRFPSHLHIDLLPRLQGHGLGRRLMETLLAALRASGSRGVHLHVGRANQRAAGFYRHVGMTELAASGARVFAMNLTGTSQAGLAAHDTPGPPRH